MQEKLNFMHKTLCFLLIWNLVLSFVFISHSMEESTNKLNQQICNLEAIPDNVPEFELIGE